MPLDSEDEAAPVPPGPSPSPSLDVIGLIVDREPTLSKTNRKIANGFTKLPLRQAMRGVVPDEILQNRRKTGFPTPLFGWLDGPLRPIVADCVRSLPFMTSPLWDGGALSDSIDTHEPERRRTGRTGHAPPYRGLSARLVREESRTLRTGERTRAPARKSAPRPVDASLSGRA